MTKIIVHTPSGKKKVYDSRSGDFVESEHSRNPEGEFSSGGGSGGGGSSNVSVHIHENPQASLKRYVSRKAKNESYYDFPSGSGKTASVRKYENAESARRVYNKEERKKFGIKVYSLPGGGFTPIHSHEPVPPGAKAVEEEDT